jgi:hypothetical protein
VASSSELAVLLIPRLDAEAANVDEGRYKVGVDDVGRQDLNEVLRHEGPDREFGALSHGSGSEYSEGESTRVQS